MKFRNLEFIIYLADIEHHRKYWSDVASTPALRFRSVRPHRRFHPFFHEHPALATALRHIIIS